MKLILDYLDFGLTKINDVGIVRFHSGQPVKLAFQNDIRYVYLYHLQYLF